MRGFTITASIVGLAGLVSGQILGDPITSSVTTFDSSPGVPSITSSTIATSSVTTISDSSPGVPGGTATASSTTASGTASVTTISNTSPGSTTAITTSSSGTITATTVTSTTAPPTSTPAPGYTIHPNGVTGKCLEVRGAVLANGTPVQIFDCNGTAAQRWTIAYGEGQVRLAGTDFCLDAGSTPANGVGMKIWQCFTGLAAQTWFYTPDNRIALSGQGQCLDLPSGDLTNTNQVQTWQCTDNNVNQIWVLLN